MVRKPRSSLPHQHGENDILPYVMHILKDKASVTTGYLVEVIPDLLPLTAADKEILPDRSDRRITQIIRNLISHRTLVKRGLASYSKKVSTITDKGKAWGL